MEEREAPFDAYLLEYIEKEAKGFFKKHNLLDNASNPNMDFFEKIYKDKTNIPEGMSSAVRISPMIAVAYEYLGNMSNALLFYKIGAFQYMDAWPISPKEKGPNDIYLRSAYATPQLNAAICNDRTGNRGRASQLFEWAAAHLTVTDGEKDQFRREGYYNMVWEYTTDRAFCLLCLERWEEALAAGEEAERWMRMDAERKEKFGAQYTPFHLLPVYLALARYRVRPTPDNEKEAKKHLMLSEFKVRVNHLRHGALLYLFELWARNPDLLR